MIDTGTVETEKKDEQAEQANDNTAQPLEVTSATAENLSAVFRALVERHRASDKDISPTLSALNSLIGIVQAAGLSDVSIEHATFQNLRALGLVKGGSEDENPDPASYSLLTIYDACFLLRVKADSRVYCFEQNLNKAGTGLRNIESDEFWYATQPNGKIDKSTPIFFQYDLSQEEDRIAFLNVIVQTAAVCAADAEKKEYDVVAGRSISLPSKHGLSPR